MKIWFVFILALLMVFLPWYVRPNLSLGGSEPYYHARIAMSGLERDDAIVNGRAYTSQPYHILLSMTYSLVGTRAFVLLPVLFAILSVFLFWRLLAVYQFSGVQQFWMLLAYVLSPPLITTGFFATPQAFVLMLFLLGLLLMESKWWMIGALFFITAAISGLPFLLAALAILLFFAFIKKDERLNILFALILVIFLAGLYPPLIEMQTGLAQYVSDFGGIFGLSIFALLMACIGTTLVWSYKHRYYGAYAAVFVFLVLGFFFPDILVFVNMLVSILAGLALAFLSERAWQISIIRQASLLVLFCGLLFSGISHATTLANLPPSQSFFDALNLSPGTMLTHKSYGFWVEFAGHKALLDPLWKGLPDPNEQEWDVATIFASTDIERTRTLLRKYNVTYVLITQEMEHGLVWEREEQGLSFLVRNSKIFKKVYTGKDVEVWQVQ